MSEYAGIVFNIMRFSVRDGPGIRTTVFLKGCPLRCAWCHNPEGIVPRPQISLRDDRCIRCNACLEVCRHGALANSPVCTVCGKCAAACPADARLVVGKSMTVSQVMAEVRKDETFYEESGGGVTFSGGEPTMQPHFLLALLKACKREGYHTAVDTCGCAARWVFEEIGPYTDLFLYDLKLVNDEAHRRYTGVSNRLIRENLEWLGAEARKLVVRVPVIPGITDGEENLAEIGRIGASLDVAGVALLPYHKNTADKYARLDLPFDLARVEPPTPERMESLRAFVASQGVPVSVGA